MSDNRHSSQIPPPRGDRSDHICRYSVRILLIDGSISYMSRHGIVTDKSIHSGDSRMTDVLYEYLEAEQLLSSVLSNIGAGEEEWRSIGICRHSRWKPYLPMDVIKQHRFRR